MGHLEKAKIKAINFDLNTKKLKELNISRHQAYSQIKKILINSGFKHRQWSGYLSKEPIKTYNIRKLVDYIVIKLPWFSSVVREFDVTNAEDRISYIDIIKSKENDISKENKLKHQAENINKKNEFSKFYTYEENLKILKIQKKEEEMEYE